MSAELTHHHSIAPRVLAGEPTARPGEAAFTQVRVLVVDDESDSADSLAAVLELFGYSVRACCDGDAALAVAREFMPEVCLLDLAMPQMDGLELAGRLKAMAGSRPFYLVAVTAFDDQHTKNLTALAGFHFHLTKPPDLPAITDLLARIGKILGHRPAPFPAPIGCAR